MLTKMQIRMLKSISHEAPTYCTGFAYEGRSKLEVHLGNEFFNKVKGRVVIDFGCGEGAGAVEMAVSGAKSVIGIDVRDDVLRVARRKALDAGVQDICGFARSTKELADVVVSTDAFEHFDDPAQILRIMNTLLKPAGDVILSFGPTWYHPLGGHCFSIFPWAHLIFSEKALIAWRSKTKTDGATRFGEVAGGLNQMTIAKFEKLVASSPLKFTTLEFVPIKSLRYFHSRLTREFTTAVVRCRLIKRT